MDGSLLSTRGDEEERAEWGGCCYSAREMDVPCQPQSKPLLLFLKGKRTDKQNIEICTYVVGVDKVALHTDA